MTKFEKFILSARGFSEWCVSPPSDTKAEAKIALKFLSSLYEQALALEFPEEMDYEIDGKRANDQTLKRVWKRTEALPFNYYSLVFDPFEESIAEPVSGALLDDIGDIYRDLSEGLFLYYEGHIAEAEWAMLDSFQTHWGRHASSAIHALHCWFANTNSW